MSPAAAVGLAASTVFVALTSCGARTTLSVDDIPAPNETRDRAAPGDANAPTPGIDAASDAPRDTGPDAIVGNECSRDAECEDRVACTTTRCDRSLHRCLTLAHDDLCDDGVFCNGAEACDPVLGCRSSEPRGCDDGVGCTRDRCNETEKNCENKPDDALCPLSHGCDEALGCQARALAQSQDSLYEVKLPSGSLRLIGTTLPQFTDIALHPNRTLYGADYVGLYAIDTNTAQSTFLVRSSRGYNALDVAPDGTIYGGAAGSIDVIDPMTGAATLFASYPNNLQSSGDLAFLSGRLLATTRTGSGGPDTLVEVNLQTRATTVRGSVGFECVWGLAAFGPTLYGLTCEGRVLTIDSTTGKGTQVATSTIQFYGASAR